MRCDQRCDVKVLGVFHMSIFLFAGTQRIVVFGF